MKVPTEKKGKEYEIEGGDQQSRMDVFKKKRKKRGKKEPRAGTSTSQTI